MSNLLKCQDTRSSIMQKPSGGLDGDRGDFQHRGRWTVLLNNLQRIQKISDQHADIFKLSEKDIEYRERQIEGSAHQGTLQFLDKTFHSCWCRKKREAKNDVASQVLIYIDNLTYDDSVMGGLSRVECSSTSTLQDLPDKPWWERELLALRLGKRKRDTTRSQYYPYIRGQKW